MVSGLFALICSVALGQGHDTPPADGMKNIAFLQGNWAGKQKFVVDTPEPLIGDVTARIHEAVGGRYLEEVLATTMPGRKPTDVRHFMTFDPKSGTYRAWWFNDSSVGAMELEGKLEGKRLVLESKPTATAAGAGTIFRATYEGQANGGLVYSLELKAGTKWQPLFRTTYAKAPGK